MSSEIDPLKHSRDTSHDARLRHLHTLEAAGINVFPAEPPQITNEAREIQTNYDALEGSEVTVGGRIEAIRSHGKATFYDLRDASGTLQILHTKQGEEDTNYDLTVSTFDTGDIIAATGTVGKTQQGEITVSTGPDQLRILAKALNEPPNSNLSTGIRRAQRYLDLMADPQTRERFRTRSRIVQTMREVFLSEGLLEVETPVLDTTYGGANAKPFTTHVNALNQDMYMKISPELYLKRIVAGLMGGAFEFARNFRNEGIDAVHSPEFTMVEAYQPYADYEKMMQLAEKMFERIALDLYGTTKVQFGEHTIDFKAPWRRLSIYDGLRLAYGVEPSTLSDSEVTKLAEDYGVSEPNAGRDTLLLELFEHAFDGKLIQPTFVIDYPRETSALAKGHRSDPKLAERFECQIGGMEVMNAYTELNDPRIQREQFELEQRLKDAGDAEAMLTDDDFVTAMEYGFPPMGGIGISIDRMTMILTDTPNIKDTQYFPLRRHKRHEGKKN